VQPSDLPQPEVTIEVFLEGEVSFAAPYGADSVLAVTPDGLVIIDDPGDEPVPVDAETGLVSDVLVVDEATVVVAELGLFVFTPLGLEASPINVALGDVVATRALAVASGDGTDDLWLSSPAGLHLYRSGSLFPVEMPDVPTADSLMAFGPKFDGAEALWVAAEGQISAVVEAEDALVGWLQLSDLAVTALSSDDLGRLWAIANGDIHRRDASVNSWEWLRLPVPVQTAAPDPTLGNVWVNTDGGVWFSADDEWWPLTEAPALSLSVDGQGRAVMSTAAGVSRITLGEIPEKPPVTWTLDVDPLAVERCGNCHGEGEFAQERYTYEQWVEEYDDILLVVKSQAMPLNDDPLTDDEIDIIEQWKEDGFVE